MSSKILIKEFEKFVMNRIRYDFRSVPKGCLNQRGMDIRPVTLDPKSFDYQFMATLDERGQGIPNDGEKREGRKG